MSKVLYGGIRRRYGQHHSSDDDGHEQFGDPLSTRVRPVPYIVNVSRRRHWIGRMLDKLWVVYAATAGERNKGGNCYFCLLDGGSSFASDLVMYKSAAKLLKWLKRVFVFACTTNISKGCK